MVADFSASSKKCTSQIDFFFSISMYFQQLVDQMSMQDLINNKNIYFFASFFVWFCSPENSQISLGQQVRRIEILTVILEKLTHRQIQRPLRHFTLARHSCENKSLSPNTLKFLRWTGKEAAKNEVFSDVRCILCQLAHPCRPTNTQQRERKGVSKCYRVQRVKIFFSN